VTAEYSMLPSSTGGGRKERDIKKLKQDARSTEIQRLIGRSLRAAVDPVKLGERQISIDCDVLQADGGTRCASITGGMVALEDAMARLVADGTLAAIATDHAPHTADEKARPFDEAPNGIIGLEAAFPVCYALLVKSGLMTLEDFLARLTTGPAKILGIEVPAISVELDLNSHNILDTNQFHSKSLNCPWNGYPGWGKVLRVF
jgi:hypothetical protein